jgi:uncharacterized membrane protein
MCLDNSNAIIGCYVGCWYFDNSNVIVGCYVGFWVHLNVIQMLVAILVVGTCELLR